MPRRAALAKAAEKAERTAITSLRKPSAAAWALNLLARLDGEQVAQLLAVGEGLREAQAGMAADDLRALTKQRRQLTAAVTTRVRSLAAQRGVRISGAVAEQVEATLTAAIVDPACGAALRSGLLVKALHSDGLGDGLDPDALALPEAAQHEPTPISPVASASTAAESASSDVDDGDAEQRAAAESAVAEAESAERAAGSAAAAASEKFRTLQAKALAAAAEVDELARRLDEAQHASEAAAEAATDAETRGTELTEEHEAARGALEEAERRLAELD